MAPIKTFSSGKYIGMKSSRISELGTDPDKDVSLRSTNRDEIIQDFKEFIEYTAFINIRPAQNNRSMEIEDTNIRREIEKIIHQLILL